MAVEVLFDPSEKQIEFLEAVFSGKYRYILFGGAIRGGKTFAGLGALLLLCKKYPGSRWAIVRDTLPTLKRNTIPSFDKICPTNYKVSYNQDTQTVTFKNGSQILFFAENYDLDKELNRWKGLEVSGFLLEEANELQEVAFYKAIERAGSLIPKSGTKPPPLILLTCNPAQNWVKELFYDRWKLGTLPDDFLYIPSKITDNPFVMADTAYVESLKNMPKYQYMVFVEGDWEVQLKMGGEFYKCFELDQHVVKTTYNPNLPLHISWDENVNPYLPLGIFQVHLMKNERGEVIRKELHMIDEIAGITPNNKVQAVCREFTRLYPNHTAGLFVYGDATADKEDTKLEKGMSFYRLVAEYLKAYKPTLRIQGINPSVKMRGDWINTVFEKEVGNLRFIIGENCKKTINDLVKVKEDENGGKHKAMTTDAKTKVRYQEVGHFSDLFDYVACTIFHAEFTLYQKGGIQTLPTTGKNISKNAY